MIRRPPRSTLDRSSAASDVYKRQPLPGAVPQRPHGRTSGLVGSLSLWPSVGARAHHADRGALAFAILLRPSARLPALSTGLRPRGLPTHLGARSRLLAGPEHGGGAELQARARDR